MLRTKFDFKMEHIPFFIYCSDDFIKTNSNKYISMVNKKNTYFTTDMFYDTLLQLLEVDKKFYLENQSLFSDKYNFNKNNLKTEYGTILIKDDPYDR